MKENHWLLSFASNTYSQTGEDGVVRQALSMLPDANRWCVEFGAWDGIFMSNVRRLIEQDVYSAVLIEGDAAKFRSLQANYAGNARVKTLHSFVGHSAVDGLDALLAPLGLPADFDFLSIDIDGNDYHVWEAVSAYRPRLVCIEFNPTIPTEVDFVQPPDPAINQGCSLAALCRLAKRKGYELVSVLPFNAIFVEARHFARFEIADNSPGALRKDLTGITWLFSGYDGSIHLSGCKRLIWHELPLRAARFQTLPAFLRAYPGNYSRMQRMFFKAFYLYSRWRG